METFTLKFTPNKEDFTSTARAMSMREPSTWLFIALLVIMSIPGIAAVFIGGLASIGYAFPLLILLGIVGYFYILTPPMVAQQIRNNERLTAETIWQVNDEGVVIKNKFIELKYDWGSFRKAVETKDHYLLCHSINKRIVQIMPKRAFESQPQEEAFRDLLRRKFKGFA